MTLPQEAGLADVMDLAATGELIKYQIGTLSETLDTMLLTSRASYAAMMSHRSSRSRTPPSPTSRSPPTAARSRRARPRAATGSPSTTSSCASRTTSAHGPRTSAVRRSLPGLLVPDAPRRRRPTPRSRRRSRRGKAARKPAARSAKADHSAGKAATSAQGTGSGPPHAVARSALLSVLLVGVLYAFVYPPQTLLDQRSATNKAQQQLNLLRTENAKLADATKRLKSDDEISSASSTGWSSRASSRS